MIDTTIITKSEARKMLVQAKARISDPKNWIKGQNYTGRASESTCFCAMGAVNAEAGCYKEGAEFGYLDGTRNKAQTTIDALHDAAKALAGQYRVYLLNDDESTTHPMIMATFDYAIARLGGKSTKAAREAFFAAAAAKNGGAK